MRELSKSQTASHEHWLENLDKIQDSTTRNYFSGLPEERKLLEYFSDAFVINSPKGRVGGDGYWLHTSGTDIYLALFTCIGEGHLASMMIRIYMSALQKMVDGYSIDFPGSILQFLHREVLARFKNKNNILLNTNANVGIVKYSKLDQVMEFAGANMDLLQVRKDGIKLIEGEDVQVGQTMEKIKSYTSISLEHTEDSNFYLCGTGVYNLIGGVDSRKLTTQDLSSFFYGKNNETFVDQKKAVFDYLTEWTGAKGQNDDIMIIGFKS